MNHLIKVAVVDDHAIFRDGLKSFVQRSAIEGLSFCWEAGNGQMALDRMAGANADIVLMDIQMPVMDGVKATAQLSELYPQAGVICLSTFNEIAIISEMINAGAQGYLQKDTSCDELLKAIRTVYGGDRYFAPEIARAVRRHVQEYGKKDGAALSGREQDILYQICTGKTSKEIATFLSISKRTVDGHRDRIMSKIDGRHTMDLLIYALKNEIYSI